MATLAAATTRATFLRLCGRQSLQRLHQCSLLPYRTYSSYNGSTAGGWKRWFDFSHGRHTWNRLARPLVVFSLPFFTKGSTLKAAQHIGRPSQSALPSTVPVELSRVMLPDDTNPTGNVHGGVILKLIEQAGSIVANRHCNRKSTGPTHLLTALVRVDHMDFHQPMYVGEVAQLQAAITYTSQRSIEVTVDVWAENVITGGRRHTNAATLWYIAIPTDVEALRRGEGMKAVPVPQIEGLSEEEMAKGKKRYEAQKAARSAREKNGKNKGFGHYHIHWSATEVEERTVAASQTTLANIVLPSDCLITGHMMGGSLMKMMDNAAGICAARHCRSRVVTACIDAIDFHSPIMNGEVAFVTARMVFTSARSMEIEVITEAEGLSPGSRRITNTAYFTFVSLGKDKRATAVPPLKLESDEERQRFEEGRRRYEDRKKMRQEMAKQK